MKFTIFNNISIEILKSRPKVAITFSKSYDKVFVIGMNKTGTTTLYATLKDLGFEMGDSKVGEVMAAEYFQTDSIRNLNNYIESAQAFQDVPFSIPGFYKQLAENYPKAKFILTIRSSSEQWLNSLKKYQTVRLSPKSNQHITEGDIEKSNYVSPPRVAPEDLRAAWVSIINRAKNNRHHTISREELSVREHMSQILRRLRDQQFFRFDELFDTDKGVQYVVVSFLAILELSKDASIELSQHGVFSTIYVRLSNGV